MFSFPDGGESDVPTRQHSTGPPSSATSVLCDPGQFTGGPLKLSGIVPHLCKKNNTALIAKERGPQEDFSSPSQYIFKKGKRQPSIAKFLPHPSVTL